jgi:hypothetical protein
VNINTHLAYRADSTPLPALPAARHVGGGSGQRRTAMGMNLLMMQIHRAAPFNSGLEKGGTIVC